MDEITIHVVSRASGKPAVARTANVLASDPKWQQGRISTGDLDSILEGTHNFSPNHASYLVLSGGRGLPSPDFMIIYNIFPSSRRQKQPFELHGFPPWQITLTEFQ